MTDYCHNKLTVVGPRAPVDHFVKRATHRDTPSGLQHQLSFAAFVPAEEGYTSEREAWGCKCGAFNDELVQSAYMNSGDKRHATYQFDTTWHPPGPFLQKVSVMYPALTFLLSYGQDSPFSRGRWIIRQGTIDKIVVETDHPNLDDIEDEDERSDVIDTWQFGLMNNHFGWIADAEFMITLENAI